MSVRLQIAVLVYMLIQAVSFGIGIVAVLSTLLMNHEMALVPWVIVVSALISIPLAWLIAPLLRARYWNGKSGDLGSRLIKSTIQGQRRGRQRRGSFAPAYRSGWRCA